MKLSSEHRRTVANRLRIALVEPASGIAGCYTYAGHNEFEPLGLEYIASVVESAGHSVRVFRQAPLTPQECAESVVEFRPDIVGLSIMTHAANAAAELARAVRKRLPSVIIVGGGYHPTGDCGYIAQGDLDFAVIGEGEATFRRLTDALAGGIDPATLPGIAFKRGDAVITTPPAERIKDLDALPFPSRSEEFLGPARMHGLMWPPASRQHNVAVILASRGCARNCYFCCNRALWGTDVVFRSPIAVTNEVRGVVERFGTNALFFSDLTFNANRQQLLALCAELARDGSVPPWYAMCTVSNLDSEMLAAMRRANCAKIGFGVEALSTPSLSRIGKGGQQTHARTLDILKTCDDLGILTKAYLIIGFPWDTRLALEEFESEVQKLTADEIRISYFTPFPGSPAFSALREHLLTADWSCFNAIKDVVVRNQHGISAPELQACRHAAFQKFYNNPRYLDRVAQKVEMHPHLRDSFGEFYAFLYRGGVLRGSVEPCASIPARS